VRGDWVVVCLTCRVMQELEDLETGVEIVRGHENLKGHKVWNYSTEAPGPLFKSIKEQAIQRATTSQVHLEIGILEV